MNNMLYTNHKFDIKYVIKVLKKLLTFKGDDFLACHKLKNREGRLAIKNLFPHVLIKEEYCSVPTFCSQIICRYQGKYVMVPNPDKYLQKLLGKRFSHSEIKQKLPSLHISLTDIYHKYKYVEMYELLPKLCSIRYKKPIYGYQLALDVLFGFCEYKETLFKLFTKEISYYY